MRRGNGFDGRYRSQERQFSNEAQFLKFVKARDEDVPVGVAHRRASGFFELGLHTCSERDANRPFLDHENARSLLPLADGAIVASCLRKGGNVMNPVDPQRVRSFLSIVRSLRRGRS